MKDRPTIRVYFNSACPVCKAGIENQKGKMKRCAVEWKDVHLENQLVKDLDADLELVRERLHLIDEKGELQVGWNAFIAIWHNSPGEEWKARLFGLPVVRQIFSLLYKLFARILYKWNRSKDHW